MRERSLVVETQPEMSATERLNKPWLIVIIFALFTVIILGIDRIHELGIVLPVMLTIYALCVMCILFLIAAGARKEKERPHDSLSSRFVQYLPECLVAGGLCGVAVGGLMLTIGLGWSSSARVSLILGALVIPTTMINFLNQRRQD